MTTLSPSEHVSFNGQPLELGQVVYQLTENGLNITLLRGTIIEMQDKGMLKLFESKTINNTQHKKEWETSSNKVHTNSIELLQSWLQGKYYEAHYKLPAHIQQIHKYIEEEITKTVVPTKLEQIVNEHLEDIKI